MDTSEEKSMTGEAQNRESRKERVEGCLLGLDEYQSSKYLGDLGDLLGVSNDEDRLQARTERIRIQKYLREKLLPPY